MLHGLRILVVEDMAILGDVVAELLTAAGATVAGPVPTVDAALRMIRSHPIDGALLDVDLDGEYCWPVAEALRALGTPFIFLTGHQDDRLIPRELRGARRLVKPVRHDRLARMLADEFGHAAAAF